MDELCGEFLQQNPTLDFDPATVIPAYAKRAPASSTVQNELCVELALHDFQRRFRSGRVVSAEEYSRLYPALMLSGLLERLREFESEQALARLASGASQYQIESEQPIGVGAFGDIYYAKQILDDQTSRDVVLKCLRGPAGPETVRRIRNEYRAYSRVNSSHVVSLYGLAKRGEQTCLVLQFCDGGNLQKYVRDCRPSAEDAIRLVRQAAEGVRALHLADVAHRDLKPDNIFLMTDGRVLVGDLGLARIAGDPATRRDSEAGAAAYLAPELLRGDPVVDYHSVDVFALGAILFFAAHHDHPFDITAGPAAQLAMRSAGPRFGLPRSDRPSRVVNFICRACLDPNPATRYTLDELIRALDAAIDGGPVPRWRESVHRRVRRWYRSQPLWLRAVAVAALAIAVVGVPAGGVYLRARNDRITERRMAFARSVSAAETRIAEAEAAFRPAADARGASERLWRDASDAVADVEAIAARSGLAEDTARATELKRRVTQGSNADAADYTALAALDQAQSMFLGQRHEEQNSAQLAARFENVIVAHLRAFGIDATDEAAVAAHLTASQVRTDLLAGIDTLALLRRKVDSTDRGWQAWIRVANCVEPSGWRHRLRAIILEGGQKSVIERHLLTIPGEDPDGTTRLSLFLHFSLGSDAQSRAALRRPLLAAVAGNRGDFWLNYMLAVCSEDPVTAIGYYRVARAAREDPVVLNNLASALLDAGRTEEANDILRLVCGRPDASPEAWNNYGVVLKRADDDAGAAVRFERAIAEMKRRRQTLPSAVANLADSRLQQGDYLAAERLSSEALDDPRASPVTRAHALMTRAGARGQLSRVGGGDRGFYLPVDLPLWDIAVGGLRSGLLVNGVNRLQLKSAERDVRLALASGELAGQVRRTLGLILTEQGRDAEGLAELLHAAALAPTDPDILYSVGQFYGHRDQRPETIAYCRAALKLNPKLWRADYWCAKMLMRETTRTSAELAQARRVEMLNEAMAHFARAKKHAPEVSEIAAGITVCHYALGDFPAADKAASETRSLNRGNPFPVEQGEIDAMLNGFTHARALDKLIEEFLGGHTPVGWDDRTALLHLERYRRYHSESMLFVRLIARDRVRHVKLGDLLNAACTSALAADGEASDLPGPTDTQRASLRRTTLAQGQRSVGIFQINLAADEIEGNREFIRIIARRWLSVPALERARLPQPNSHWAAASPEEREQFQRLWAALRTYADLPAAGNLK